MTFWITGMATLICFLLTLGVAFGDLGHGATFAYRMKAVIAGIAITAFFAHIFSKELKWRKEDGNKKMKNSPAKHRDWKGDKVD